MYDDEITIEFGRVISVTASSSTRATTIQLAGVGSEGDDDGAERGDSVEVLQPAGIMAAPAITASTEAPFVRLGDRHVALGLLDKGAAAQGVEGGETRVYGVGASNSATVIRLRANGNIEITAGASQNIILNGGALNVARATDPVIAAAGMTTWMTQVAAAVNGLVPGAVVPPSPADFGTVTGGNARVKA